MSNIPAHYKNKGDLTKGDIRQHLLRLTLPMAWGIFVIISFQLIDTFYISRLGTQTLAAFTFTFPVTYFIFSLIMGISIAISSVLSRQIGEGNQDKTKRIATHGLIIACLFGIMLSFFGISSINPLFKFLGANDTMLPVIHDYMFFWYLGATLVVLPMCSNSAMRASGDSMTPAIIMTIAAAINIVLDPLLIFGLMGFPRLEVAGAAIATIFANAIAGLTGLYILFYKKNLLCRDGLHLRHFKDSCKRILFIALPVGLTNTLQPITDAVIIALLAAISAEAVAAFGVAVRLESFAFAIIMALSTGMAPIIGQNWGNKNTQRVQKTIFEAFRFAAIWSLSVGVIFFIFAEHIGTLFNKNNNAEFMDIFTLYFWIVSISYIPLNIIFGWASVFNAIGKPKRSLLMIMFKLMILQIPLAIFAAHYYGAIGIFIAMCFANITAGLIFHFSNKKSLERNFQARLSE